MEKLRISDNGRYFVTGDGKPFSFLADTVWTMPQRLKWDDAEYLMKKRKSQGFTVLQLVALDPERDELMRSPAGDPALLDGDLDRPNERYFSYLDWILDKAEEYGFYVLLLPVWGQLVVGENWMGQTFERTVTEENAYRYGAWIGARYKDRDNILWCLGGDRQPIHKQKDDYRDVWRRMAEGLAFGVTGKKLTYNVEDPAWRELLITYHACHEMETGECSTMSYWTDEEAWIAFIMLQSGHGIIPKNYELVAKEYGRSEVMPVWDGEPAYEKMPTTWPVITDFHGSWMVRKRAYWSLLAGSFGHTYGHCSVWCSISQRETDAMCTDTWYEALHSEGSAQMKHLRAFMDSLQPMTCSPAQERILSNTPEEPMELHAQASVFADQTGLVAYLPSGGGITLNLSGLSGAQHFIWWYDPRKGTCAKAGTAQPADSVTLTAPTAGVKEDWLLILTADGEHEPVSAQTYFELEESHEAQKVFEW